jgi:hypothetical protein
MPIFYILEKKNFFFFFDYIAIQIWIFLKRIRHLQVTIRKTRITKQKIFWVIINYTDKVRRHWSYHFEGRWLFFVWYTRCVSSKNIQIFDFKKSNIIEFKFYGTGSVVCSLAFTHMRSVFLVRDARPLIFLMKIWTKILLIHYIPEKLTFSISKSYDNV